MLHAAIASGEGSVGEFFPAAIFLALIIIAAIREERKAK